MAEDFGIQGRGGFYDATGAVRDVIQNHLFQLLSNLAMEPPARMDSESLRDEKVKVLKSIPALRRRTSCADSSAAIAQEPGVAADSQVETYAAIRLHIDSWRWQGVPFYIRAGKCLPVTCDGDHHPPAPAANGCSRPRCRCRTTSGSRSSRGRRSRSASRRWTTPTR